MELSQRELHRVKVIENAVQGRITVAEASGLLQLSARQVKRLKARYEADQVDWVRHGNRGQSRPWAISEAVKKLIIELARGKYVGFNDSHLTEKLVEAEKILSTRRSVSAGNGARNLPDWILPPWVRKRMPHFSCVVLRTRRFLPRQRMVYNGLTIDSTIPKCAGDFVVLGMHIRQPARQDITRNHEHDRTERQSVLRVGIVAVPPMGTLEVFGPRKCSAMPIGCAAGIQRTSQYHFGLR